MNIRVARLVPGAQLPRYGRPGDAGLDIVTPQQVAILPHTVQVIPTGLIVIIPPGYVGLVWDRGGMAAKKHLHTIAGVVDSNYRGELQIVMYSLSFETTILNAGDRIAQLLVQPVVENARIEEIEATQAQEQTARGDGRFLSSGA